MRKSFLICCMQVRGSFPGGTSTWSNSNWSNFACDRFGGGNSTWGITAIKNSLYLLSLIDDLILYYNMLVQTSIIG